MGSAPGLYEALDQNLKKKAGNIMKKAKEICATRSVKQREIIFVIVVDFDYGGGLILGEILFVGLRC